MMCVFECVICLGSVVKGIVLVRNGVLFFVFLIVLAGRGRLRSCYCFFFLVL